MKIRPSRFLFFVRVAAVAAGACASLAAQSAPTMFPPVRGIHEMVGAANNFEVEAGFRILTQGGNAVDAGVASVLAASVTELSRFGIGGEMPLLIKMAGQPPIAISGVGVAPAKATVEYYEHRRPEPWEDAVHMPPVPGQGVLSAITPGVFDGLILALEKYGTKTFAEVAEPAIEYADQGFPMPEEFGGMLANHSYESVMALWPDSMKFFYPQGAAPPVAAIFREPMLANTYRELAAAEKKAKGKRAEKLRAVRDLFYKGSIAKRIADASEKDGGLIRYEDLANFHADEDQPKMGTYHGYEVYKPGFWTQGPVMIEALNILEGFDLKSMGHNSPEYLHTLVEAVKLAFADRDLYYGDPKFSKIPEEILLSKEYASERRKLIDPKHASMEHRPGNIGSPAALPTTATVAVPINDTTCVNVVDRQGNAFNATPSGAWLPSVIMGDTGIPLSTRLQSFVMTPGHPNQLQPGKRPRVTLSPTLVTHAGKLELIMSTPGGDNQDQALLQVLLNILDFGMSPQAAVEAPRFQTEHFYSSFAGHEFVPGKLNLEGRMPKSTVDALAALGHRVTVAGDWSNSSAPTVIWVHDSVLNGGADPRRGRFIFGR